MSGAPRHETSVPVSFRPLHPAQTALHAPPREPLIIKSSSRRRGPSNVLSILDSRLRGNDKNLIDQSFPRHYGRVSGRRPEVDDVTVPYDIVPAFQSHPPGFLRAPLA